VVKAPLIMITARLLLAIALALGMARCPADASELLKIDPAHSIIAFQVRHLLGNAKGKFTRFSGTIDLDHEQLEKSSVTVAIQVVSIDTGIAKRDEHLRSEEFFNAQKYPEITFKSRQVKQTGANKGELTGDLTIHGVTRPITLRVELLGSPESALKEKTTRWRITTAPIKRAEFGLSWSKGVEAVSMISNDVTTDIQIEAARRQ
jgi:polyisoprenoid-binding protein YceI